MGSVESKVNVEAIKSEVESEPVVMYTKASCGYCHKAKELLDRELINYKECDLDQLKLKRPMEYASIVNGLVYKTRQTSVPQIFICGRFIGGFTELNKLKETKQLWEVLAECTRENPTWEG